MAEPYFLLKELVESERYKELECRFYLQYVKDFLMKETPIEFVTVETEYITTPGRSDYIISGKLIDSGTYRTHAYLWELKAPQCYIFEKDTENRLKPSSDLIDAENKLLHYYDDLRTSDTARQDIGVGRDCHIHLGGIIIGRENALVNGEFASPYRKKALYSRAIDSRRILYDDAGIKLVTWDQILSQLKPVELQRVTRVSGEVITVTINTEPSYVTSTTPPPFIFDTEEKEE